jgi:Ca2+-binding EF-hand superfamily protein
MTSISGYSSYSSVSSYFQTRSSTQSAEESGAGASLEDLFSSIDSDGDGSVSKTELKSFADSLSAQMQSALLGAQESGGAQGAFGPPPPPPGEGKSAADMMSEMDTDGDGSVSSDELKAFGEAHGPKSSERASKAEEAFASADTDGDGKLSSEEFETFDKTMRENFASRVHERMSQAYSQAQNMAQPDFASWFSNANSSDTSSNSDDIQKRLLGLLMQA